MDPQFIQQIIEHLVILVKRQRFKWLGLLKLKILDCQHSQSHSCGLELNPSFYHMFSRCVHSKLPLIWFSRRQPIEQSLIISHKAMGPDGNFVLKM